MAGGIKGNQALAPLKKMLRDLPITLAAEIAAAVAPGITTFAQAAYDSGVTVYGDPRPTSNVDGSPLELKLSGSTRGQMRFVSTGRIVRCVLGPPYAKYLIGKYGILPNGNAPTVWNDAIRKIAIARMIARTNRVA